MRAESRRVDQPWHIDVLLVSAREQGSWPAVARRFCLSLGRSEQREAKYTGKIGSAFLDQCDHLDTKVLPAWRLEDKAALSSNCSPDKRSHEWALWLSHGKSGLSKDRSPHTYSIYACFDGPELGRGFVSDLEPACTDLHPRAGERGWWFSEPYVRWEAQVARNGRESKKSSS